MFWIARSCYHMCCCQPKLQKILHHLVSLRWARGRFSRNTRVEPRERARVARRRPSRRETLASTGSLNSRTAPRDRAKGVSVKNTRTMGYPRVYLAPSAFPHALGFSSHPWNSFAPSGFPHTFGIPWHPRVFLARKWNLKNIIDV